MARKRSRKRDTSPEAQLQRVIAALEASDEINAPQHAAAIRALVLEGPFQVNETFRQAVTEPDPDVSLWRAELVKFLRTVVQWPGHLSHEIQTLGRFRFSAGRLDANAPANVLCHIDAQSIRDVAILHLLIRLHEVGLHNVRVCEAPGCSRLFVKTYRRAFCSTRCQQRANKRAQRAREAQAREQQQRRRRRIARVRKGVR